MTDAGYEPNEWYKLFKAKHEAPHKHVDSLSSVEADDDPAVLAAEFRADVLDLEFNAKLENSVM